MSQHLSGGQIRLGLKWKPSKMEEKLDPENWAFDVFLSNGIWSRVVISRLLVPNWLDAYSDAALLASTIHGGMITDVLPRY